MATAAASPLMTKFANAQDLYYSTQMIRWFLKPIGAWPESRTASITERVASTVLICTCWLLIVGTLIPIILYTALTEGTESKLQGVGPMSFWTMATLKYLSLLLHANDIQDCLDHVEADWRRVKEEKDREIMLTHVKSGRYIASFCMVFMHGGVFSYDIVKGLSTFVVPVGNESFKMHIVPLPFYNGIANTEVSPAYEVVFTLHCLSTFVVNSITVGACGLAVTFVAHACGQLEILMFRLQSLVRDAHKGGESLNRTLGDIVEDHMRTLSFVSRIEDVMHQICLVELVGCTLNMCHLGYYILTELEQNETKTSITICVIFVSVSFNIYIFCYVGEILSEQCRQVGEVTYMTEWYLLPKETVHGFTLIILRSSIVIQFTAGKLKQLSISTFGDVFKTAMAYLNMLRTVA